MGLAFSFGNSDYTQAYIKGYTIFGDYPLARRLSLAGEFHDQAVWTPDDIGETSLMFGAKYKFSLEERATLYLKAMGGVGRFEVQPTRPNPSTTSYGAFGGGAGVEFRASHRINIRAIDLEYQEWPGYKPNGLTPWVASMGAAWMF